MKIKALFARLRVFMADAGTIADLQEENDDLRTELAEARKKVEELNLPWRIHLAGMYDDEKWFSYDNEIWIMDGTGTKVSLRQLMDGFLVNHLDLIPAFKKALRLVDPDRWAPIEPAKPVMPGQSYTDWSKAKSLSAALDELHGPLQ